MNNTTIQRCVFALLVFGLSLLSANSLRAQVTVNATGGIPNQSYFTVNDAFTAINAGDHQGSIEILVGANTVEPALPVALLASGQGASLYTDILIRPTAVVTVAATPTATNSAVFLLDGADNVTIDGSINVGGTSRDLTIQNLAANTVTYQSVIRLIARTTLGLGTTNVTIKNCNIIGSTAGNNGYSGSTLTTSFGILASGSTATSTHTTAGGDYDNITIDNNEVTNCHVGIAISGTTAPNTADNNVITNNIVGSTNNATTCGLRGIYINQNVGTVISLNKVQNISANTSISVAGIEVAGTASSACQVLRNEIAKVESIATSGWGAYGINLAGGANHVVVNNVIYGVITTNYSNTSNTFNAFGIRIAGGTGYAIHYNSVNLTGAHTTALTAPTANACFGVTSTAVTLTATNNIFNNQVTTTTSGFRDFFCIWFPASYNFANATLNNNFYGSINDADHKIGKAGTTSGVNNYADLNTWKAAAQVGNPTNESASQPSSAGPVPFVSATNLTIPAGTLTAVESGAVAVPSLGSPNIDFLGTARPSGTGIAPDMGAYEIDGVLGDFVAPVVTLVTTAPTGNLCVPTARTITADATDNVGVATATLSYSFEGVAQTPIAMTLTAGTGAAGTWSATIPAAAANQTVTYSVQVIDSTNNSSSSVAGIPYIDGALIIEAGANQTVNVNTPVTLNATVSDPTASSVIISEVILFKTGTGVGTYPSYLGTLDNDYIELTNTGTTAVNIGGWKLQLLGVGTATYTLPSNIVMAPNSTVFIGFLAGEPTNAANKFYSLGVAAPWNSSSSMGLVLRNSFNKVEDAFSANGFAFAANTGVTSADWTGTTPSGSGRAGFIRTALADNNLASDWILTDATNLSTPQVVNVAFTPVTPTSTITWNPGSVSGNALTVTPTVAGTTWYYASYSDGICSVVDSASVTATIPVTPVADFSATPLAIAAGANVTFTDLSTNIPTGWNWVVTPSTGVVFVSGTNASTQNPVIQFNNAGNYTVQLTASNVAGSDDTIKVNYVAVSMCASGATNTADTDIGNVTFAGINQGTATPTISNPAAIGLYTNNLAGTPANVVIGSTYPLSLSQITSGVNFYGAWFNVFIDWNQDGAYDNVTERVYTSAAATSLTSPTQTANILVPFSALAGTTTMRVVLNESGNATSPACGTFTYGETEDYTVNVTCFTPVADVISACTSYTWPVNGQTYTTSGNYSTTGGCPPSTLNLTILNATSSSQSATACSSYTWALNNQTYTASGAYTDTLLNAAGCDSVITLNLTINQPTTSSTTVASCYSYTWASNGTTYTTSGVYLDTLVGANGCDSISTLNLTINLPVYDTLVETACSSFTWNTSGMTYTTSGMYTDTITGTTGCDSIVTLDLTINMPTASSIAVTSCSIYTWASNGQTYTASGAYLDTLVAANGCDSVVTLNLTILQPTTGAESATACSSYTWTNGVTYTTSGTYYDVLTGANGCDSIVALTLTILPTASSSMSATECTSYTWASNGVTYTTSGVYTDTLVAANGCDSIVTLNLTINSLNLTVTNLSPTLTCNETSVGTTYQWIDCGNGNAPIAGATFVTYTATANGSYAVVVTKNNCSDTTACETVANVGLETLGSSLEVVLAPNPTSDFVKVMYTDLSDVTITVMDATGKIVIATASVSNGENVDFRNLDRGVYFVQLNSENGSKLERVVKN